MLNKLLRVLMCSLRPIFFSVLFVMAVSPIGATLIIPPSDMNTMIKQTELLVYGQVIGHADRYGNRNSFRIIESFKGDFVRGQVIEVHEYSSRNESAMTAISGDVNFKIGSHYLLFLSQDGSGHFKPSLLSLSVYEEISQAGKMLFVHNESILDVCYLTAVNESLLNAYPAKEFKEVLRSNKKFILDGIPLNKVKQKRLNQKLKKSTCAPPAHCATIIGEVSQLNNTCNLGSNPSPAKHQSTTFVVKVADSASDDPSQANAHSLLIDAVAEINNFSGLNVTISSPLIQTCPTENCQKVSEVVDNDCNPTGTNEIWVFFDDPCDEVPDLVNCGGFLGLGGTFAKTPCHADVCGDMWLTAYAPYVVLNNGLGCLSDYNYIVVLIHEMIHSFNVNHIAGSCTAIMNGGLCNDNDGSAAHYGITQLDRDCIEWMYNQCPVNETFTNVTYDNNYADSEFAQIQISASNVLVEHGADIKYDAGSMIALNPAFEVELGAVFHARIGGCVP